MFWMIFVRMWEVWQPHATVRGGLDYKAYRTQREAKPDMYELRQKFGRGNVRLYKFKPEAYIFGFSKLERHK